MRLPHLCHRHKAQLDRTAGIWPHLSKKDLKRRAYWMALQCRDCQGLPEVSRRYLPRDSY